MFTMSTHEMPDSSAVTMAEQLSHLRQCRMALDDLLAMRPGLARLICGTTTLGNLRAELGRYRSAPVKEKQPAGCGNCHKCLNGVMENEWPATSQRMIVCADCHNKRCPKASDHELPCSRSNDPGQPGSVFGGLASQEKQS